MDCTICSSFPMIIRPPRNTICSACFEGIKCALALTGNTEVDNRSGDRKFSNLAAPNKGVGELVEWIKSMKNVESELNERIDFLAGSLTAFSEQIHTDIHINPGDHGPSINAHKSVLASRSEIFKNMLDSDVCKAPPESSIITLPGLAGDELESLLEFLYAGDLPSEKIEKHAYSLSLTAHKFEITYLQKFCDRHMLRSLSVKTALDVLEISDMCSNQKMKARALGFIVGNFEEIAFSEKYEEFCRKNPHLSVQITRAILVDARSGRVSTGGEVCSSKVCGGGQVDGSRMGDSI
ncbi:hypothetical protein SAY86_030489 [Trapa natans]|uniref:BTB domain-containing protein n=1 Tax=Trapa natans TaxID=22666 RepID=A0AAN7LY12_TRANT|nr:hypothetical protein SAY86_030489 [Trapa natans]